MTERRHCIDSPTQSSRVWNLALTCAWLSFHVSDGFLISPYSSNKVPLRPNYDASTRRRMHVSGRPPRSSLLMIYAPPGSGYRRPEDEESELPDSYVPMMEYPGTMRPGRTPENMPFHDLPIADSDPDPVPWPHFQEIEWHHRWDPPHPHPIPMEE